MIRNSMSWSCKDILFINFFARIFHVEPYQPGKAPVSKRTPPRVEPRLSYSTVRTYSCYVQYSLLSRVGVDYHSLVERGETQRKVNCSHVNVQTFKELSIETRD